jgi:hypothetical protein
MSLQIDVPDERYEAKAFYRNRAAADAVILEIKTHIKETGLPHTWRHHTHSKPVTNSRIVYLGQFDLPKSHQAPDRFAPCPCCCPTAPKYSRKGKIAWFPDEHVIRMIGPDCFQTLNPEGHWEAVENFDREEAERHTISYLINNLHVAGEAIPVLTKTLPTLLAIDEVHQTLQSRLNDVVKVDLWRHVQRGDLMVNVNARRFKRKRDGSEEIENFLDEQRYGPFPGFQVFNPRTSKLASRLKGCITRLGLVDFGDELNDRVREMEQEQRAKAASILSRGLANARAILDEAMSMRAGLDTVAVSTLRGWTKHEGCPVSLHIDGDRTNFYIGTSERSQVRIELPAAFWNNFGEVPAIATVKQWAVEAA